MLFDWPKRMEPRPSFRSVRRASGRRSRETATKSLNGARRVIRTRRSVSA